MNIGRGMIGLSGVGRRRGRGLRSGAAHRRKITIPLLEKFDSLFEVSRWGSGIAIRSGRGWTIGLRDDA